MATDIIQTTWVDVQGLPYSIPIYINSGQAIADIQTASDAIVAALDDVTGGVLQTVGVFKSLTPPSGVKESAVAGSNRKDAGVINFETGEREGFSFTIPAIDPTLISGDTLPSSTDTETFTGAMVTGSTPVLPCDQSGVDLTGVRSLKRGTRKYRKAV